MNRIQAVDAANVIMHIRPDWQQPGIIAVLLQLDLTYPAAILHAVRVAVNPASRTPAAITATPIAEPRRQSDSPLNTTELVALCPHCDSHGYLPNGYRCPHEAPEVTAERAHRGAQLARAQLAATQPPLEEEDVSA